MEEHRNVGKYFKIYLCKWWWVVETKESERKKKKKGILEDCLLFSFLLFCLFSQGFFTCDFGPNLIVFFVFWGFDFFRDLEIFNWNKNL